MILGARVRRLCSMAAGLDYQVTFFAEKQCGAARATSRIRFLEFDLTASDVARLRGPVGLYIGSRTLPEIAISILAEVTAAKNGVVVPMLATVEGAKTSHSFETA